MKKVKLIVIFSLISISLSIHAKVLDEKGDVLPEVIEIFRSFSPILETSQALPQKKLARILGRSNPGKISLSDLNKLAQEKFKRPQGMERRDITEFNKQFILCDNKKVRTLFSELGDIDEVMPSKKPIDYIFINGSTVKSMRKRIMFFVKAYQDRQINLSARAKIVFLTGDRTLYPEEDKKLLWNPSPYKTRSGWQAPSKVPKNEFEAAQFIWNQLDIPDKIRDLPILFVYAPKPKILRDGLTRPHTYDTIVAWRESDPDAEPGHAVSFSDNPYIYYQQITVRTYSQKTILNI